MTKFAEILKQIEDIGRLNRTVIDLEDRIESIRDAEQAGAGTVAGNFDAAEGIREESPALSLVDMQLNLGKVKTSRRQLLQELKSDLTSIEGELTIEQIRSLEEAFRTLFLATKDDETFRFIEFTDPLYTKIIRQPEFIKNPYVQELIAAIKSIEEAKYPEAIPEAVRLRIARFTALLKAVVVFAAREPENMQRPSYQDMPEHLAYCFAPFKYLNRRGLDIRKLADEFYPSVVKFAKQLPDVIIEFGKGEQELEDALHSVGKQPTDVLYLLQANFVAMLQPRVEPMISIYDFFRNVMLIYMENTRSDGPNWIVQQQEHLGEYLTKTNLQQLSPDNQYVEKLLAFEAAKPAELEAIAIPNPEMRDKEFTKRHGDEEAYLIRCLVGWEQCLKIKDLLEAMRSKKVAGVDVPTSDFNTDYQASSIEAAIKEWETLKSACSSSESSSEKSLRTEQSPEARQKYRMQRDEFRTYKGVCETMLGFLRAKQGYDALTDKLIEADHVRARSRIGSR